MTHCHDRESHHFNICSTFISVQIGLEYPSNRLARIVHHDPVDPKGVEVSLSGQIASLYHGRSACNESRSCREAILVLVKIMGGGLLFSSSRSPFPPPVLGTQKSWVLIIELNPPDAQGLPVISVLKHIHGRGGETPVAALAGPLLVPRQLHKAIVQAEIVPDGVLPALLVVQVVRESVHDEGVDLAEGHLALWAGRDGHGDQSNVGIRRLLPWLCNEQIYKETIVFLGGSCTNPASCPPLQILGCRLPPRRWHVHHQL